MNWTIIGTIATIIGIVVTIAGIIWTTKRLKNKAENTNVTEDETNFSKLLSIVKDESRKRKIEKNLQEIKSKGFTIDIYEVQVETNHGNDKDQQRHLITICSTYHDPQITPIWKKKGKYCGQTTYAFIKNRYMWITDKRGRFLSKESNSIVNIVKYIDARSNTPSDEIPDFWTLGETSKQIRTSVILPLRLPKETIACFGFIDFESKNCVDMNDDLWNLFKEIADVFALDYLENIIGTNVIKEQAGTK
jgi:hypothetical protein